MYNSDPTDLSPPQNIYRYNLTNNLRQNFDRYVHKVVTLVKIFRNSTKR